MTLIALDELRQNPFRDFTLYPVDEEHVERLRQSIEEDGFFASVTARPAPGGGKGYELAAGHHRIEATKRAGLTHVEVNVQPYDDAAMVRIMIRENTGQRGHAAAALDSVAAQAGLTAYAVLASERLDDAGNLSKILVGSGVTSQKSLETARASVAADGPGARLLYRAINGFDKATRRENKDAEQMTSTAIEDALKRLKASGVMAKIVAEAEANAAAWRVERRARDAERAQAQAAKQKAAEENLKAAAREAAEDAARAHMAFEEARKRMNQASAAEKDRAHEHALAKAAEAHKKKVTQDRLEKQIEKKAAAAAKEAEQEAAEQKRRDVEAAKAQKRAEVIAEQLAREATYDIRCDQCFRTPAHAQAFMQAVTSENGRRFIPLEQQLPLAERIRETIDALESNRSGTVGSQTVIDIVDARMAEALRAAKGVDEAKRNAALAQNAIARVQERWRKITRYQLGFEAQMKQLQRELTEWEFNKALFPVPVEQLDEMVRALERIKRLRDRIAGGKGEDGARRPDLLLSAADEPDGR